MEVEEVMKIYTQQGKHFKPFKFTFSDEIINARIDSMKFVQSINKLVSNAIKFTGEDARSTLYREGERNSGYYGCRQWNRIPRSM